eukprot:7961225-Alexandrium_andersonii.AAC.1
MPAKAAPPLCTSFMCTHCSGCLTLLLTSCTSVEGGSGAEQTNPSLPRGGKEDRRHAGRHSR